MQIVTSIEQCSDFKNMLVEESLIILRSMRRDFVATKTKGRRNTSYSDMRMARTNEKE